MMYVDPDEYEGLYTSILENFPDYTIEKSQRLAFEMAYYQTWGELPQDNRLIASVSMDGDTIVYNAIKHKPL